MTDYTTEAQAVASAIAAIYENKQTNKKDSISGDYSSDSESYPTVKAVKNQFGTKVTSWSNTVSDSNYPSEKLVKNSIPGAATSTPLADATGGALGTSSKYAKEDHQHPLSTAYAANTHSHSASEITDSTAYTNIGTTANATQAAINSAIDTKLSAVASIDLVCVQQSLPTASASTMNKLYLVPESTSATYDNYQIYVTVRTGTSPNYSYTWEKVDTARIDLSGYSTTSHTHGNISSDGKVGTASGKPLITTTGGSVTTGAFGTSSGQFAEGNHTHSSYTSTADVASEIGSFATALASAINPSS